MSKARGPYRVDPLGHKKSQQALDKKAENARELGLDYEPAQQEPSNLDVWKARALQAEAVIAKFMAEPAAQQEPDNSDDLTIAYMVGVQHGKKLAQRKEDK